MHKFTKSIFINRPQQDVFDFMSNPGNISKWRPSTEFAEWTSTGAPGIGSTFRGVSKILGRKSETVFEITSWDPPDCYAYKSVNIPFPVDRIEAVITLAPEQNGTQLIFEAQIGTVAIFRFAESMLGKLAEKQDGSSIDTMKELLEAG